ncbi:MAG: cytochrome c3 family protein, partial [Desulfobulbaceae bacterium]|nr:cytochrome c3 family protein [Desulfobulbaceae bacterium]
IERTSTAALGYAKGNCAHCHELKGGNPSVLFSSDNICLQCHTNVGSLQTLGIDNRSYSYRAGGYYDGVDSVEESFSFDTASYPAITGTSHDLSKILTFISTPPVNWGFTSTSNPCTACHNPHAAKKITPISLPSLHSAGSGGWGLWGDVSAETMSTFSSFTTYQALYRHTGGGYEPKGDATPLAASQSTTNFIVFCTKCHNAINTIFSTRLGRNLRPVDWETEKHGKGIATSSGKKGVDGQDDLLPPYSDTKLGDYVLSCLDCHEPHGSANAFLLRPEVNGVAEVAIITEYGDANGPAGPGPTQCNKEWTTLCARCHTRLSPGNDGFHLHQNPAGSCTAVCHQAAAPCFYPPCGACHYHGSLDKF